MARTPLTSEQVRRSQRIDFGMAAMLFAYGLALFVAALCTAAREGISLVRAVALLALTVIVAYLWRVACRRWRRL